jgi:energy-coupling factor transporter transmembrane protein EcfT
MLPNKQEKPNTAGQIDNQRNRVRRRTEHIDNSPEHRHDLRSQPGLFLLRLHPGWCWGVVYFALLSCASLLLLSLLTSTTPPHPITLDIRTRFIPHKKLLLLGRFIAEVWA